MKHIILLLILFLLFSCSVKKNCLQKGKQDVTEITKLNKCYPSHER